MTIKGYWVNRRFWWSWTRGYWIRKYYKIFHHIQYDDFNGSMLPDTRDSSKYKRVQCKGHYIEILDKDTGNFVRIIPYTPNHGVMVESWKDGKLHWRNILNYEKLINNYMYTTNVEWEGERRKSKK